MFAVFIVLYLALFALMLASVWKVFEKAGQPGWAAVVPIYNSYVMTTGVAGKPPLWFLLMFVPLVNVVISLIVIFSVAQKFGKGGGFGVGLLFLPFVFFPVLGFGDAEHESQRRGRGGRDYSDYADDDEDEAEEDERPSRRRAAVAEDRPAKRRRPVDDDDDEDDPPARRRRRDDD